jgi:glycosyltransferase involved in cell wall biosynthesis
MKILWVSNHSPFQVDFGGGQRSNLIYRTLREIAEIDVLILSRYGTDGSAPDELYGTGDGQLEVVEPVPRGGRLPWRVARPLGPALVDRVAYNLGRRVVDYLPDPAVTEAVRRMQPKRGYDLFVGRHLKNSGQAGLLRTRRAIVDVDDNEIDLYRWILKDPSTSPLRKLVLRARVRKLESLIPRVLAHGPRLWVTKKDDLAFPGFGNALVLPNIPYALAAGDAPRPLPHSNSKTVLFVGMLGYLFNIQALDWFLANVWPEVHAHVPDATFRIVGSRLQEAERARWSAVPGVHAAGFVDDIATAYRDCSFVVAPIWSGGGTNIKTLEALLYGRTCILTPAAYKGFSDTLPQGEAVLVAEDATQLTTQCIALLRNPSLARKMGLRGAAAVRDQYSFERFRRVVLETAEETLWAAAAR